ncbi:uncharacterized protein [Periplaneta americana]|uniref:uncharacterized protein isoform X2 n=1 Tax=Periplaneta americana TaxID=6978 RepID=UPI0037E8FB25
MASNLNQVEDSVLDYEMEVGDRESNPDSMAFSSSGTCRDHVDWSVASREDDAPAGDPVQLAVAHILNQGDVARAIQNMMQEQAARILKEIEERAQATLRHVTDRQPEAGGASKGAAKKKKRSSGGSNSGASGRCCREGTLCGSAASSSRASSRPTARAGGELVDAFDPDDCECNVDRWLNKIDQLGRIHDWSDYERAYFMQTKLGGGAKAWYNRLDDYDLSWSEWKKALRRAFPRQHDFGVSLEELVARRKLPDETKTKYCHTKLALCKRYRIKGEDAICIIRGLQQELQGNTRAYKCKTPGELYSGFLSTMDRYRESGRPQGEAKRWCVETGVRQAHSHGRAESDRKIQRVRCFNCQELGTHLSRNCQKPKTLRCMRCGQADHTRFACPNRPVGEAASKVPDQKTTDGRM